MKIFMIDNYDSFTYNLVHLLYALNHDVVVARNDEVTVSQVASADPDGIVIGPGPSRPERAGISVELIRALGSKIPLLGVCLGHQAIGVAYGARIERVEPVHGKRSSISHSQTGLFAQSPAPLFAARYHSLAIERASLPEELEVTAWDKDQTVMAIQHRTHPVVGLQFHPESILTDDGQTLVGRFLDQYRGTT